MNRSLFSNSGLVFLFIVLLFLSVTFSGDLATEPTVTIVYSGDTTIKDMLATKGTDTDRAAYLSSITGEKLKPIKFPYFISDGKLTSEKTVIAINGYRCNGATPPAGEPANMCGYWIAATKNKVAVATNSPVWIYPAPYQLATETTDTNGDITVTVTENPQAAMEQVLIQYVRDTPTGKAVIGTAL